MGRKCPALRQIGLGIPGKAGCGIDPCSPLFRQAAKDYFFCFSAASMKPLKSGCGWFGFDRNSGWNWEAMKNG